MIEALVGMMIVGATLTGIFAAMGQSFRLTETSRDATRIAQIMQSELEDLRTLSWSDIQLMEGWASFSPEMAFTNEFGNRYQCYRYVAKRWDTIEGTLSDQYRIRIYVTWTTDAGLWQYNYFETWYTKEGLNDYYYRSF